MGMEGLYFGRRAVYDQRLGFIPACQQLAAAGCPFTRPIWTMRQESAGQDRVCDGRSRIIRAV